MSQWLGTGALWGEAGRHPLPGDAAPNKISTYNKIFVFVSDQSQDQARVMASHSSLAIAGPV